MNHESSAPSGKQPRADEPRRDRAYQPPRLQEYGSLKDLTRTFSVLTPGDAFGGSYAT